MILSRLSIVNFKNIAQADLSFSPNINCFLGNNGMGKSNLLDAIYYLSFCKSYTRNPDSQNIRHGEDFFVVQGYYERNGNEEELYCGIKRRQKKAFKRNKKEYDRLSDHIGFAPLVMAAPSDNELILGGSEERRKFIDLVISQFDKQYLSTLIRYNKALEQRNALLRQECSEEMLYDIWEEQMDSTAAQIHNSRDRFLQSFIPVFRRFYNEISSQNESADLIYKSHLSEGALLPQLKANRHKDLILGYTSRGIHRDDMDMMLGEYPMKRIGSQGQCKTYLIALKLAQYDFLREQGDTTPILLLDDIFDKLDAERVKQIVKLVSSDHFGQIFITDTNRKYLDEIIHFIGAQYNISPSIGEKLKSWREKRHEKTRCTSYRRHYLPIHFGKKFRAETRRNASHALVAPNCRRDGKLLYAIDVCTQPNALCASIICRSSQRADDVAKRTSNPYQRRIRTSGYRQHYFQIKIKKQTMETTSPAFRHTLPLQLRFNDIDLLGHVNNSVYFSFYDLGKARYFETVKAQNIDWKKADVVVANVNADFLSPIYPGEPIAVQTCTVEIGNRSFKLLQQIVNTETGQIKGVCHTVMVGFDITAGRAAPISDEWKEALCRFEGKELRKK